MVPNLSDHESPGGTKMPSDVLHATVRGQGPAVLLLHGLFGMGSNLGALARSLEASYEVHLLDLPNHGRSHWSARMGIARMADAVGTYIQHQVRGGVARVIGHSLGGKVAMQLALGRPDLVAALVIADIAPIRYAESHQKVFAAIKAVSEQPPVSRKDAAGLMRDHLEEEGVLQFLLLSLKRDSEGRYHWRFNADGLRTDYLQLLDALSGEPFEGPALSIYGAQSSYVGEAGRAATRRLFPGVVFVSIADTGHWLHAEKTTEFNDHVLSFLDQANKGRADKTGMAADTTGQSSAVADRSHA